MSEETTIRAEQIDGLEELLNEVVRKQIARPPLTEDIERLRKSPTGAIIRLEEQVKILIGDVRKIETQINNLESRMEARFDDLEGRMEGKFDDLESRMATKDDLAQLTTKFDNLESRMDAKFDDLESRMATKDDLMAIQKELEQFVTKQELHILGQELKGLINTLGVRIEEQGKRLAFFQTVTYSIFGVLFAMVAGVLLKLLFG